jgi:asparagine synthase (glutamine-hydrolysing)
MCIAGAVSWSGALPSFELGHALSAMSVGVSSRQRSSIRTDSILFGAGAGAFLARHNGAFAIFSGRIDNRAVVLEELSSTEELASTEELSPTLGPLSNDAEIALAAFAKWGDVYADRLFGAFACALWDHPRQRLLLTRDSLGLEPLHLWTDGDTLIFASEPRGLLAADCVPKRLNRANVAQWLANRGGKTSSTFFETIRSVSRGGTLIVDKDGERDLTHWRPEALEPLHCDGQDYPALLRKALEEAVHRCLPAKGAVGCFLSGGLDSTTVAAIAARKLAEEGRTLTAFTAVPGPHVKAHGGSDYFIDESAHAAELVRMLPNVEHVIVRMDAVSLSDAMDLHGAFSDFPSGSAFNLRWFAGIAREAKRRNIAVMLDATGGNMTASFDGMTLLPALLRKGRLLDLYRVMRDLRANGFRRRRAFYAAIAPLMSTRARRWLRRLAGRSPEPEFMDHSPILPEFARASGLMDQVPASNLLYEAAGDGRATRLAVLRRGNLGLLYAGMARMFGCKLALPLLDRELVELCLRIPEEQFLNGGQTRALMRRATHDLLPPAILNERRRGKQSGDWAEAVCAERAELLEELSRLENDPVVAGVIDLARLRKLLNDWPENGLDGERTMLKYGLPVMRGLMLARFVRRIEGAN